MFSFDISPIYNNQGYYISKKDDRKVARVEKKIFILT